MAAQSPSRPPLADGVVARAVFAALLRLLIALPLLLVLALFALSNQDSVALRLWPSDYAAEMPLSSAILLAAGAAFAGGALLVWVSGYKARRRARRAEQRALNLEAQLETLRADLATLRRDITTLPPSIPWQD